MYVYFLKIKDKKKGTNKFKNSPFCFLFNISFYINLYYILLIENSYYILVMSKKKNYYIIN